MKKVLIRIILGIVLILGVFILVSFIVGYKDYQPG